MNKKFKIFLVLSFFVFLLTPNYNALASFEESYQVNTPKKSFVIKSSNIDSTKNILKEIGVLEIKQIDQLSSLIVDLDEEEKNLITKSKSTIYLEENKETKLSEITNDTYFANQSYLQSSNITKAWDITTGLQNITVAVIDTGVNYLHEDLKNNMWKNNQGYYGYDFVNLDNDPMDDNGHGTSIAGIIAAQRNNSLGISGIANVKIMSVKAVPYTGEGIVSDLAMAITYAADNGARVANVSLGLAEESTILSEAINYAKSKNCLVVAATGNMYRALVDNPARNPDVIGVTALNENETRADYANYGLGTSLTALGNKIFTTAWQEENSSSLYGYSTGTSFATPQVTATVALLLSQDQSLTTSQLKKRIQASAKKIPAMNGNEYKYEYGYGKLDAYNALVFDKTPPEINITLNKAGDNTYYINGQVSDNKSPVNIMPEVPVSNIKSLRYRVDNTENWVNLIYQTTQSTNISQNLGNLSSDKDHIITLEATDTANNIKTITLNSKDALLPVASSRLNDYQYQLVEQSPYANTSPNQTYDFKLVFKNTGSTIWNKNTVKLGTSRSNDRASLFANNSWLSTNRIAMKEDYVAIGELAHFEFSINTKNNLGSFNEYFNLVADGIGWMKDIGIYWKIDVKEPSYNAQYINQSPYVNMSQDETATIWVEYKNTGTATWNSDTVKLGTSNPLDRESSFNHDPSNGGWLSKNRIKMNQSTVLPGETAKFIFTITPPKVAGTYYEYFRPVADGIKWMEDFGLFWEIIVK